VVLHISGNRTKKVLKGRPPATTPTIPKDDIEENAFSRFVHDLATDQTCCQTQHKPADFGQPSAGAHNSIA
jgi:hypothetical protein